MAHEINLVPDIKDEMIKTLKLRNFIFFLCIIVASVSAGIAAIFGAIAGGQGAVISGKSGTITLLSNKLNSYSDLTEFLTIKDQVNNINTLAANDIDASRLFNVISTIFPSGADSITITEMTANFGIQDTTISFEANADAGKEPFIDYNVLESFKKSMEFYTYDYGDYVDSEGNTIPPYCIIEHDENGATLMDSDDRYYAYWTINDEGCNPGKKTSDDTSSNKSSSSSNETTSYQGKTVVQIWRTPLYSSWYKEHQTEGQPYISLDGQISGVPHFESKCISRTGAIAQGQTVPKFTEESSCKLVPGVSSGVEGGGIQILESANGKTENDELVLRFSARISFDPGMFLSKSHHAIVLPLSGHHNVTDSYVQVQSMFGQRAKACEDNDQTCQNNKNANGE